MSGNGSVFAIIQTHTYLKIEIVYLFYKSNLLLNRKNSFFMPALLLCLQKKLIFE